MASLCVLAFATLAVPGLSQWADGKTQINDRVHLDALNRENAANTSWVAGVNPFFEDMTFDEARALFGTHLSHISEHLDERLDDSMYDAVEDGDIPASFDARTKWPGLIHPIRDQHSCQSCWAFSASEVLSDRVAIATGKPSPVLSPEDMVSCDGGDTGCRGGEVPTAWKYLKNTGIVSDACFPYQNQAPSCPNKCVDQESWNLSKVKAKTAYAIFGVKNMQKEIMTNGPIQGAFALFKSFMSYKSGVYKKHWYEVIPEGGHAVKIVGWGTENSVDYWLVANSWSTTWGMEGFFKIARGQILSECGIEIFGPPYAGMPEITSALVV